MKKPENNVEQKSLPLKTLRALEGELGVYLAPAVEPTRALNQQFAVLDEDEKHVRDIVAEERFFTEDELREKIKRLFG